MVTTQSPAPALSPQLLHFLRIARQGKHAGCSSGERMARKLARAIIEHTRGLDDDAIRGAVEFLKLAADVPESLKTLIR